MKYERNNESSRKRVRYDNLRGLEKTPHATCKTTTFSRNSVYKVTVFGENTIGFLRVKTEGRGETRRKSIHRTNAAAKNRSAVYAKRRISLSAGTRGA